MSAVFQSARDRPPSVWPVVIIIAVLERRLRIKGSPAKGSRRGRHTPGVADCKGWRCRQGFAQLKLAASSVLPDPLYFAAWGWGQSGRRRSATPFVLCSASTVSSPGIFGTINSQATLGGLFGALGGFQTGDAFAGKVQDSNVRNIESTFDPIYRSKTDIYELNFDWDITDSLKFTSLTSYTEYDLYTRQDYTRHLPSVPFNTTPNPVNALAALGATYSAGIYPTLFPGGVVTDPQSGHLLALGFESSRLRLDLAFLLAFGFLLLLTLLQQLLLQPFNR